MLSRISQATVEITVEAVPQDKTAEGIRLRPKVKANLEGRIKAVLAAQGSIADQMRIIQEEVEKDEQQVSGRHVTSIRFKITGRTGQSAFLWEDKVYPTGV